MARQSTRNRLRNALLGCAFFLLTIVSAVQAKKFDIPSPADPYASPKTDPYNPLKYITSNALTAVGLSLTLAIAIPQSWFTWKIGGRFMLAMVISEYTYALGIGMRFGLHAHPESSGIYIIEYLFVTLSPCGFIAAEYVLLGRMAGWLKGDRHLLIPPRKITLVFVLSDVTTFLIQAIGGCISASAHTDPQKAVTGSRIFLAGLALQLASFFCFTVLYMRFIYRMRKYEPKVWTQDADLPWYKDWRSLAGALSISCIGVLVRSVYRTIELSEGYQGHLTTTESFFYLLDLLPLLIALAIYLPFWPGRFIPKTLPSDDTELSQPEKIGEGTLTGGDGRDSKESS